MTRLAVSTTQAPAHSGLTARRSWPAAWSSAPAFYLDVDDFGYGSRPEFVSLGTGVAEPVDSSRIQATVVSAVDASAFANGGTGARRVFCASPDSALPQHRRDSLLAVGRAPLSNDSHRQLREEAHESAG